MYRLLSTVGLFLASTLAVFALLAAAPGGPSYAHYFAWLFGALHGDLGTSPSNEIPVSQALAEHQRATIELLVCALAGALALGAVIGFIRARARAPLLRGVLGVLVPLVFRAVPFVMLAVAVQLLFAFTTALPTAGIASADGFDLRDRLAHLIEPVILLTVPFGAWSSLIFYDFFRTPDAAAWTPRDFVRPAAMTAALIGPPLLAATFVVEATFAWPGVARLFFGAFRLFDPALIAGCLLVYLALIALLKLPADLTPVSAGSSSPQRSASPERTQRSTRFSALAIAASVVLLLAAFGAVAANIVAPADPNFIDQAHWQGYPLAPGVAGHPLGTDENGRDLLSRLVFGLRASLGIALFATMIATAIGALVAKATKAVPWLDQRSALTAVGIRPFAALPFILAAITVLVKAHSIRVLSPLGIALIIAAVSWPAIVPAFRRGASAARAGVVSLAASALLLEVTLSIWGFGVRPPGVSLGNIMANMTSNIGLAPWVVIAPAVAIVAVLFSLYAVGDELRSRGAAG